MIDIQMLYFIELGYQINCSRCSIDEFIPGRAEVACKGLRELGWTIKYPQVFCPQCNGERR